MKEIEVLNNLSGYSVEEEDQLATWVKEIKDGVLAAEKASGKGSKVKTVKGGKRKKTEVENEETDDEDS